MRALLRDEYNNLNTIEVTECYETGNCTLGIESIHTVFEVEIPYSADIPYFIKRLYTEGALDLTQFKTKPVGYYIDWVNWEQDNRFESGGNI